MATGAINLKPGSPLPNQGIFPLRIKPRVTLLEAQIDTLARSINLLVKTLATLPAINDKLDCLIKLTSVPLYYGTATGGSKNRLVDNGQNWESRMLTGCELTIIDGAGAGQTRVIKTNDEDTLTPRRNFDIDPDETSVYIIRQARSSGANKPAFITGQRKVTAHGTAMQLPDIKIPDGCVLVIAPIPTNTGYVYLGNSKANAESSTNRFDSLDSTSVPLKLRITNANLVFVDSDNDDEGISYITEQVA